MKLPLKKIRLDGGTQPRQSILNDMVGEYAEEMASGMQFPPLTVFYDGLNYWLVDGFHRAGAAMKLGLSEIDCIVHQGTLADAQWYSFSANRANGMRRTNADKARAVKAALRHSKGQRSDHDIARHVGVSHGMVGKYRDELEAAAAASRQGPAPLPCKPRLVTRNGTTYTMMTGDIGRRFPKPAKPITAPAPAVAPFTYTVHLPPGNPLGAAMVLKARCSPEYLAALIKELSNLLHSVQPI